MNKILIIRNFHVKKKICYCTDTLSSQMHLLLSCWLSTEYKFLSNKFWGQLTWYLTSMPSVEGYYSTVEKTKTTGYGPKFSFYLPMWTWAIYLAFPNFTFFTLRKKKSLGIIRPIGLEIFYVTRVPINNSVQYTIIVKVIFCPSIIAYRMPSKY